MKKAVFLLITVFFISFFIPVMAEDKSIVSTMDAMKVTVDKDSGEELLEPVEGEVYPGDIIAYILTYENKGEEVIKNLKPVGPVPLSTEYSGDSEKSNIQAGVEFSIDGGETYGEPPLIYEKLNSEGNIVEVEATPDMYTHVRWTVAILEPGEKIVLEYRVIVK